MRDAGSSPYLIRNRIIAQLNHRLERSEPADRFQSAIDLRLPLEIKLVASTGNLGTPSIDGCRSDDGGGSETGSDC